MRRSLRLVAALFWLLDLGACADEPEPKTPVAMRSAPQPEVAEVRVGTAHSAGPVLAPSRESHPISPRPVAARPASEEHLAERFGRSRSLSVQQGSASYYSDVFTGRSTASGAPYEPHGFTAAHRSLPFGTVLRVTRLDGGQVVYVRVTDRGPYGARGRILDLSRAAAEQLGMMRIGVIKIKAEVVEYGARKKKRRRH